MQYLVTTPKNPAYDRKVYGIQFNKGRAVIADAVLDPSVKLSADEIATRMKEEYGYAVRELAEAEAAVAQAVVPASPAGREAVVPAHKSRRVGKYHAP